MKKILLYIKLQYKLLIVLGLFILAPFYFMLSMEMKIPNLPYFFLLLLVALKFIVFKKRSTHKKIKNQAIASLSKIKGKSPSNTVIVRRSQEIIEAQDSMIILIGVCIIMISILFNAF